VSGSDESRLSGIRQHNIGTPVQSVNHEMNEEQVMMRRDENVFVVPPLGGIVRHREMGLICRFRLKAGLRTDFVIYCTNLAWFDLESLEAFARALRNHPMFCKNP
jgi:hypothetical protein